MTEPEKCSQCGRVSGPHPFECYFPNSVECCANQLAQSREREAVLQKLISAQDEQLLSLSRERDTEKARREKAEVECFDLSVDLDNMSRAAENLLARAEKAEADLANVDSFLDRRDAIDDLPDRYAKIQKVLVFAKRTEKAEAILRAANFCEAHEPFPAQLETGCPMCEAVHQADLREKAEERERRLREAAWPVADQVAEVVVMGADKSQCRLVPVGLLLTLREALAAKDVVGVKQPPAGEPAETLLKRIDTLKAKVERLREALVEIASYRFGALPAIAGKALAAKPKAPSAAEGEVPNDA